MAAAGLEQLRDIHLPAQPALWPPAPGWWLLALLGLAALAWLAWRLRARRRRLLPVRHAGRLYAKLHARWRAGALSRHEYLDACNELLKRVLIHGLGRDQARRASGQRWLELLDRELGGAAGAFAHGPGQVLGDARFRPGDEVEMDPDAFHELMLRFLDTLAANQRRAAGRTHPGTADGSAGT